jgi:hypothetical protein
VSEFLSSCIFLFVKHPYDGGDRINFKDQELIVLKISLMHTLFRGTRDNTEVQIPHSDLASGNIENMSRTLSRFHTQGKSKDPSPSRSKKQDLVFTENVEVILNPSPLLSPAKISSINASLEKELQESRAEHGDLARYFSSVKLKVFWVPDKDKTNRSLQIEFEHAQLVSIRRKLNMIAAPAYAHFDRLFGRMRTRSQNAGAKSSRASMIITQRLWMKSCQD